jgi:hypothetical protein
VAEAAKVFWIFGRRDEAAATWKKEKTRTGARHGIVNMLCPHGNRQNRRELTLLSAVSTVITMVNHNER